MGKKTILCLGFLCVSMVTIISFMVSSIALFRNVYIAEHQQEIEDLLEAYLAAQSQMHAAYAPIASEQAQPKSLFDSYTERTQGSEKPMVSFALKDDFFSNGTFVLPDSAVEIAKNTYLIGERTVDMNDYYAKKRGISEYDIIEPDLQNVQILVHLFWEKDYQEEGIEAVENEATTCYTFNAVGAFWKSREDYILGTANTEGLSDSTVADSVSTAINTWQVHIPNHQVIGSRVAGTTETSFGNDPNGKNELIFGSISTRGVIAVTITYGIFNGDISNRRIVEWKMILNQVDYNFGDASVNSRLMDLLSIVTHEFGHVFGMGDIYSSSCSAVTMNGYSSEGQINKRTLESPDVTGIRLLYGEATQTTSAPAPSHSPSPKSKKKKSKKKKKKKNREEASMASILSYSFFIQAMLIIINL